MGMPMALCMPAHLQAAILHQHPNQSAVVFLHGMAPLRALLYPLLQPSADQRFTACGNVAIVAGY